MRHSLEKGMCSVWQRTLVGKNTASLNPIIQQIWHKSRVLYFLINYLYFICKTNKPVVQKLCSSLLESKHGDCFNICVKFNSIFKGDTTSYLINYCGVRQYFAGTVQKESGSELKKDKGYVNDLNIRAGSKLFCRPHDIINGPVFLFHPLML